MKATDRWAVPLTHDEHKDCHQVGSRLEREWFANRGIFDPYGMARELWAWSGDHSGMCRVMARFRKL